MHNLMERAAARRVVVIASAAAVVLAWLAVLHAPTAGAVATAPTQTTRRTSSTTTSTTDASDATMTTPVAPGGTAPNGGPLLVPGASDAPASAAADVKNNDNTGTVVALVISGLLVVALLLGLLTYWYWRNTRPLRHQTTSDEPAGAT